MRDLTSTYSPNTDECSLAQRVAKGKTAQVCFLVLLKTFQRLGYFTRLRDVPPTITGHVSRCFAGDVVLLDPDKYDNSGTRRRHVPIIRNFLGVTAFGDTAREVVAATVREAALTKDDLADIINASIEELIRNRFELPGFTTLLYEAQRGRTEINSAIYRQVFTSLGSDRRCLLDRVLVVDPDTGRTPWRSIREDHGRPTLTHLRDLVRHLHWLRSHNIGAALDSIPIIKVQHFASEAKSLDAARMQEMKPQKRYTLLAALVKVQVARCLDDLGEVFIKRMSKIHRKGRQALDDYRHRQQERTDQLIEILGELVTAMHADKSVEDRLVTMTEVIGGESEQIIEDCKAHAAYADNNESSLLWRFYKSHRQTLFALLGEVRLASTSQDIALEMAIDFLQEHKTSKRDSLELGSDQFIDLSWIPEKWRKLVTGSANQRDRVIRVDRRHFEVCLFSRIVQELKSGDLCIEGSDKFADYRDQLISWEDYERDVAGYGEQVGIPVASAAFVAHLRDQLETTTAQVDMSFPDNDSVRMENGVPVLRRLEKREQTGRLKALEQLIAEQIESVDILGVLADTENWLNWAQFFGPVSGHDTKIASSRSRYVAATFCYGCNLGPTQTARSLDGFDRRQLAWVNQRHVTTEKIDEAITAVINAYNRFALPKFWGSGRTASADGTKWDVYEQNLLSEYHVRYGGYGGIGYYHVSDTYVALFSHFIPCGVWEAVYILDGLLKNKSDIQPNTIHADTQGQSTPVFGLAYLLGIELMPRIRNWKDLKLFRASKEARYEHIDGLFSDVIDWEVIATHLPDMLRVGLSIKAGHITASTLLRKLGNYSRKNRLYQAFRELGRVVRTVFLLRYISDSDLRQLIQAATNKSESFNRFVQWLFFGGDRLIAENDRDKQRKLIKYNHLVANCLIFHNVFAQTKVLRELVKRGHDLDDRTLARLSPYITQHVNRFGTYTLDLKRQAPTPVYALPDLVEV